jgi:nucleoside-diphosphate-sugar epimerase
MIKDKNRNDILFHLASRSFVPDSWEDPEQFIEENVALMLNMLNYCRLNSVPLIYISAYIYGHQTALPISEAAIIQPSNPYAQSKYVCEQLCEFYVRVYSLDVTILRPFNVYGPGQDKKFLIPEIIGQVRKGERVLVNSFKPKRDYIYVEDVVEAIVVASGKIGGLQTYNLGTGTSNSVKDIIRNIENILGIKIHCKERGIIRNNEIKNVVADISNGLEALGWRPVFGLREGLSRMLVAEDLLEP